MNLLSLSVANVCATYAQFAARDALSMVILVLCAGIASLELGSLAHRMEGFERDGRGLQGHRFKRCFPA